jgi:hypothetical protein
MGFPLSLISTIMKCVTTVSFPILINGQPTKSFKPQRGLRQGDPLSPYLFMICADVLSGLLTKAQDQKAIHGIKIAKEAPMISHLLFADDSLIFCKANKEEAQALKDIISLYESESGQKVNFDKSEIIFSKKVKDYAQISIIQTVGMKKVESFSKYLGMPTHLGRSKRQVFEFIQDRILKKLNGWKEKHLSFTGRSILIKVVAQSIPTYIMSGFLLPKNFCKHLEKLICDFWWGSNTDSKKCHWIKWAKLCKSKVEGGMGFRDLRAFNLALLSKQVWRIQTQNNTLMARVLKAKYFPN